MAVPMYSKRSFKNERLETLQNDGKVSADASNRTLESFDKLKSNTGSSPSINYSQVIWYLLHASNDNPLGSLLHNSVEKRMRYDHVIEHFSKQANLRFQPSVKSRREACWYV